MNIISLINKVTAKLGEKATIELGVGAHCGYFLDIRITIDNVAYTNRVGISPVELALLDFENYLDYVVDEKIHEILVLIEKSS